MTQITTQLDQLRSNFRCQIFERKPTSRQNQSWCGTASAFAATSPAPIENYYTDVRKLLHRCMRITSKTEFCREFRSHIYFEYLHENYYINDPNYYAIG